MRYLRPQRRGKFLTFGANSTQKGDAIRIEIYLEQGGVRNGYKLPKGIAVAIGHVHVTDGRASLGNNASIRVPLMAGRKCGFRELKKVASIVDNRIPWIFDSFGDGLHDETERNIRGFAAYQLGCVEAVA